MLPAAQSSGLIGRWSYRMRLQTLVRGCNGSATRHLPSSRLWDEVLKRCRGSLFPLGELCTVHNNVRVGLDRSAFTEGRVWGLSP